jgi:hypothetical protein
MILRARARPGPFLTVRSRACEDRVGLNLEKANRKGAKAQSLAKAMHCMESTVLSVGEPIVCKFSLRYSASLRLCGNELQFLG